MKSFVNTAKIEYLAGEEIKTVYSNRLVLPFVRPAQCISGEVFCRRGCRRWTVRITEKDTDRCVFRLSGYVGKGFYFETNPCRQYCISFEGDKDSTMRLYSIPDCATVCHDSI